MPRAPLSIMVLTVTSVAWAQQIEWRQIRPTNTGILGDYVQTIFVGESDMPWIGAYTPFWEAGGMSRFNGLDEPWTAISSDELPQIISPRFNDIIQDQSGIMWIASDHGLFRFDPEVGPSSLVRYDHTNTPMPASQIPDIDVAPDGTIWIAINDVNDLPPGAWADGGLARFDPAADTWEVWTIDNGLPWGKNWPNSYTVDGVAVLPTGGGNYKVWIDPPVHGLAWWENGKFGWVEPAPPYQTPTPSGLPGTDPVDELGNTWITVLTASGSSLARLAPDGAMRIVGWPIDPVDVCGFRSMSGGRALLGSCHSDVHQWDEGWSYLGNWASDTASFTLAFAEESDGQSFWVGGIGGSARYHDGAFQRYRRTNTGMTDFFMETIAFAPNGDVYMDGFGGPEPIGGFDILHPDGTWTNVNNKTYGVGYPWGFPDNLIVDGLWVRATGKLLIAMLGTGAHEWEAPANTYTPVGEPYNAEVITEDSLGRVWFAAGYPLVMVDQNRRTTVFDSTNMPGWVNGTIREIRVDPINPGFIWFVKPSRIYHTDGITWESWDRSEFGYQGCCDGHTFLALAPAHDGAVWFGVAGSTDGGLFHFDPSSGAYTKYTPANSTLVNDEVVRVEVAPDDSVWVNAFEVNSAQGGLTHFDGTTWTTYTAANSPLLHDQLDVLRTRPIKGGYELWIGTAFEGINVVTVAENMTVPGHATVNGNRRPR